MTEEYYSADSEISDKEIEEQNKYLLRRQVIFRLAASFVAREFQKLNWVKSVALFGSVAKPLQKEIPRFRNYHKEKIEVWHECKDLDLAVWVTTTEVLNDLRQARTTGLKAMQEQHPDIGGVAHHQVDVFIIEAGSNQYLGRLCAFNECPKPGKSECKIRGCGQSAFLKMHGEFILNPEDLSESSIVKHF